LIEAAGGFVKASPGAVSNCIAPSLVEVASTSGSSSRFMPSCSIASRTMRSMVSLGVLGPI